MKVLVTGGAGYIGSVTVRELIKEGYEVVIFDSLVYGHEQSVPKEAKFIKGDLQDKKTVLSAIAKEKIEAVVHFAGASLVGESVKEPLKYFRNNVGGGLNLLESMKETGVDKIIFSSSAAVYGEPERIPIQEDDHKEPTNPYGETKLMFEKFLKWFGLAYGIRSVCLRYFNAAGADTENGLGEDR